MPQASPTATPATASTSPASRARDGVVGHDRVRHDGRHPERLHVRREPGVEPVEDEDVHPVRVQARDAERARLVSERREHPVGRALQRTAGDDRAHRDDRHAPRAGGDDRVAHPRDGQHRPDRHEGVRGADDDRCRGLQRRRDLRCGPRVAGAPEAHLQDQRLLAQPDEVLLELEPAVPGPDLGPHRLVRHRQDSRTHAQGRLEAEADRGRPLAGAQAGGPCDVRRKVAVPEPEPRRLPVARQLLARAPGVAVEAPAGRGVLETRERVHARVVVGHDEQRVALRVVAGVDDDVQPVAEVGLQPLGQLRPADAAGEGDHATGPADAVVPAGAAPPAGGARHDEGSSRWSWISSTRTRKDTRGCSRNAATEAGEGFPSA